MAVKSEKARKRRHRRIRTKISGTSTRPRLNVNRSLKNIYVQVIDDVDGHTLVAASTLDKNLAQELEGKSKREQSAVIGKVVAERALDAGIDEVVFDRGGYLYHGRVKALAEGAAAGQLDRPLYLATTVHHSVVDALPHPRRLEGILWRLLPGEGAAAVRPIDWERRT